MAFAGIEVQPIQVDQAVQNHGELGGAQEEVGRIMDDKASDPSAFLQKLGQEAARVCRSVDSQVGPEQVVLE
jgi:hypothetical protein